MPHAPIQGRGGFASGLMDWIGFTNPIQKHLDWVDNPIHHHPLATLLVALFSEIFSIFFSSIP